MKRAIALVSGIGITALFSLFGISIFGQLREEIAYCDFAGALAVSNYYASEQKLDMLLTPPRIFEWVDSSALGSGRIPLFEKKATIRELHAVVRMLEQHDYQAAARRFNSLRDGKLANLLWAMPGDRDHAQLLAEIQRGFAVCQQNTRELAKKEAEIPGRIEGDMKMLEHLRLAAHGIREDFGELLSVPEPPPAPGQKLPPISYYSGGVLKGLPVLPKLPDRIDTLLELRRSIEEAGGEVSIKGEDAPVIFRKRLEELRISARSLRSHMLEVSERISALETEQKAARLAVVQSGTPLENGLKDLLLVLCDPQSNTVVRKAAKLISAPCRKRRIP